MLEKIIATILFAFCLWIFVQGWHYFSLVWLRSTEYLQQLRNNQSERNKSFRFISRFRNSPYALGSARLITLFYLLLSLSMLIVVLWVLLATWLEWSTLFG
jgi:hypothetical protein